METIDIKARAKINLTLDVKGKRDDGYHTVEMVMQQIDLYDDVTVSFGKNKSRQINVRTNLVYLPDNNMNTAYKAAHLMSEIFCINGSIDINIDKKIPVSAGLAGGSADAAAVISGLNDLLNLGLDDREMRVIGLEIGADVPFCIAANTSIARGIGEELEPIKGADNLTVVLAKPQIGVSTREIYKNYVTDAQRRHPNTDAMVKALADNDIHEIRSNMRNVLEDVTLSKFPKVKLLKMKFKEFGAPSCMMTGSGPTVYALFSEKERDKALSLYRNLVKTYKQAYIVKTYNKGRYAE